MTPTELLSSLRGRGIRVSTTKAGSLRLEPKAKLTPGDRACVKAHSKALLALLALDAVLADEEARDEARARAAVAEAERRNQYEADIMKAARMSAWDVEKVRAMASAGKLTPSDVQLWREVRAARLHREYRRVMEGILTQAYGREVRIVGWRS